MYAVIFDIDASCLDENYHIRKFMESNGFTWKQGSVYFGGATIDAVTCVLAVQNLAKQYAWFATCVKDIRMLRIEESNDLMPAIR